MSSKWLGIVDEDILGVEEEEDEWLDVDLFLEHASVFLEQPREKSWGGAEFAIFLMNCEVQAGKIPTGTMFYQ